MLHKDFSMYEGTVIDDDYDICILLCIKYFILWSDLDDPSIPQVSGSTKQKPEHEEGTWVDVLEDCPSALQCWCPLTDRHTLQSECPGQPVHNHDNLIIVLVRQVR
jgi:hypothetical protein